MFLRWFVSSAYRHGFSARKRFHLLLAGRRDEMSAAAVAAILTALAALDGALRDGHAGRIRLKVEELEFAANQWMPPYAHRMSRGVVELLLVALVVALGLETFFIQPFRIPTSSMQPTLYGVNYLNMLGPGGGRAPQGWTRMADWLRGFTYVEVTAPADGEVQRFGPVKTFFFLNLWQDFWLGGARQRLWFPPDLGEGRQGIAPVLQRFVRRETLFNKGETMISLRRQMGDYLLADVMTYNFRKPARGEIVVFKTGGIAPEARQRYNLAANEFYIKRLVGLPGEHVQIGDDRHVVIDGKRLDAATPHFARVYGFGPRQLRRGDRYLGHLNGWIGQQLGLGAGFAPLFPDAATTFTDGPDQYLMLGDNTVESLDSRYWGTISGDAVVGRCWLVFWPLTKRFGWQPER